MGQETLFHLTKVSHPYFIGAFGLNCFTSAHKYWKLTGQLQKSVDALGGGLTKIYCQVVYEERNKVCTFAT